MFNSGSSSPSFLQSLLRLADSLGSLRTVNYGLAVAFILWLSGLTGVFEALNGRVADLVSTGVVLRDPVPPAVVVVELPASTERLTQSDWETTLEAIAAENPKAIAVIPYPGDENLVPALKGFSMADRSFLGVPISLSSAESRRPDSGGPADIWQKVIRDWSATRTGVLVIPELHGGYARTYLSDVNLEGENLPSLVAAVGRHFLPPGETPRGEWLIDFSVGRDFIPILRSDYVLNDRVVGSILENRIVVLGPPRSPLNGGVLTPIDSGGQAMGIIEYVAYALHSLQQQSYRLPVPAMFALLLLSVTVTLWFVLYHHVPVRYTTVVSFLGILITSGVFWLAWNHGQLLIPVTEILMLQAVAFGLVFRERALAENEALGEVLSELTTLMKKEDDSHRQTGTKPLWQQAVIMITQQLDFRRLVFLERVSGSNTVRERHLENCRLEDIVTRRREIFDYPFKQATDSHSAIRLAEPMLSGGDDQEEQFLLPLYVGAYLIGFVLLELRDSPRAEKNEQDMLRSLTRLAQNVADLVFVHRRQEALDRAEKGFLQSVFNPLRSGALPRLLADEAMQIKGRLEVKSRTLENLGVGVAMYDLYGNLLYVNKFLHVYLSQLHVDIHDLQIAEVVSFLSGWPTARSQQAIADLASLGEEVLVPVVQQADARTIYQLRISFTSAQSSADGAQAAESEAAGSPVRNALLVEYLPVRELQEISEHASNLQQLYLDNLEKKITSMMPGFDGAAGETDRALDIVPMIRELQQLEINTYQTHASVVIAYSPLKQAIENCAQMARSRNVAFHQYDIQRDSIVVANFLDLRGLLEQLLGLLVRESETNSAIRVKMSRHEFEGQSYVEYYLDNRGFSLPTEALQEALSGSDDAVRSLAFLFSLRQTVESWGGRLIAACQNHGLNVRIHLREYRFGESGGN